LVIKYCIYPRSAFGIIGTYGPYFKIFYTMSFGNKKLKNTHFQNENPHLFLYCIVEEVTV